MLGKLFPLRCTSYPCSIFKVHLVPDGDSQRNSVQGKKACWERARPQLEGKAPRNSCYVSELEAPNHRARGGKQVGPRREKG